MTFLENGPVRLVPLTLNHVGEHYLSWLNGPKERLYRGPKAFPAVMDDVFSYIASSRKMDCIVMAIETLVGKNHVGNISLNPINWIHGNSELSILIGSSHHGMGYGRAAIEAVTKHAFGSMRLNRLWAESPNPAFNHIMTKLGWKHEGTKREAFLLEGEQVDIQCWGLLKREAKQPSGVPVEDGVKSSVVQLKRG